MVFSEKLFTKDECDNIIDYHKIYTDLANYYPEEFLNGNKLEDDLDSFKYETYIIHNDDETKWFFDRLLNWFSKKHNLELDKKLRTCSLHKYIIGDFFKRHTDLAKGHENRRYNLGIQLNENYEGGEYVYWDNYENEFIIPKSVGTAISYHCRVPHEIREIKRGERWSIVMPISYYNIKEKNSIL